VSGQVTTTIADAGPVLPQVKSGTVRALAVAAPKRMEDLPDVPTLNEAGADVDAVLWSGIFLPKGTPPAIVKKLEGEFMRSAKLPDVIARLKPLGIEAIGNSSDEFARILAADIARWRAVAKPANIKIEQERWLSERRPLAVLAIVFALRMHCSVWILLGGGDENTCSGW